MLSTCILHMYIYMIYIYMVYTMHAIYTLYVELYIYIYTYAMPFHALAVFWLAAWTLTFLGFSGLGSVNGGLTCNF